MIHEHDRIFRLAFTALLLLALAALPALSFGQALTPAFTYQGELRLNTGPATGEFDMEFRLYDAEAGGSQIGSVVLQSGVSVVDGLFSVPLDFGTMQFAGDRQWLEVRIGDVGSGLETLSPRTEITATPYAWIADSVVNDATGNDWRLGGNAGTNPASNFIGTTDSQPLVLRVEDVQALRLEPSAETFNGQPITANVIAGSNANIVSAGVRGATISGGGVPIGNSDPDFDLEAPNEVTDHYGTVSGGYGNVAGDSVSNDVTPFATVGGGRRNTASGSFSTVSGGENNTASEFESTVSGGGNNTASGFASIVSGGQSNLASGTRSTVSGGRSNSASGGTSAVSGGQNNTASEFESTVSGGENNTASGSGSTVSGGQNNTASGSGSTVSGGFDNCAGGVDSWAAGRRAKVRPGSASGDPGIGCLGYSSGVPNGDSGTFVWADRTNEDFVSTGPSQFLVRASGGVGLGTNAPAAQLHVTESINTNAGAPGNHVAIIENDSSSVSNGPDVLALKTSAINPDVATNLITFFDGSNTPIGRIEGDGAGGITFGSGGADFAEWLPKRSPDSSMQPGDVVGWHADGVSHETRGALRVMAVSTQPIVTGNAPPEDEVDDWARIGFVGQVPVRVRGPVAAGDWILPSGHEDGTGTAVSPLSLTPGDLQRVIGRALVSTDDAGIHSVNVVVGLGNHDAVGGTLARMKTDNGTLRSRIDALEATNERMVAANSALKQQLAEVREAQRSELAHMRDELDRLQNLLAPRLAVREP